MNDQQMLKLAEIVTQQKPMFKLFPEAVSRATMDSVAHLTGDYDDFAAFTQAREQMIQVCSRYGVNAWGNQAARLVFALRSARATAQLSDSEREIAAGLSYSRFTVGEWGWLVDIFESNLLNRRESE